MKIALLIGGMLRQHSVARKSWNLIKELSLDIYFSTWDKSIDINPGLGIYKETVVTEDQIIHPAKISIQNSELLNYNSNFRKQMHHWQILAEMLPDVYDIVIITRPDLYFQTNADSFLEFLNTVENNTIYTLYQMPEKNHIDDLMLISTPATFKSFVESTNFSDITPETRCHNWLYNEFRKMFDIRNIKGINNVALCRATCNDNDTYETIVRKAKAWQHGLGLE